MPLSGEIALLAAEVSLKHTLPMADAIVYATAMKEACPVVTSDPHFKGLADVIYLEAQDKSLGHRRTKWLIVTSGVLWS